MDKELKRVLVQMIRSHSKLASAEYKRNRSYNNTHYSAVAETEMIKYLTSKAPDVLEEVCRG